MPDKTISKKQLVKHAAAQAAASCIGIELPLPQTSGANVLQPEQWIATVCRHCEAGCTVDIGMGGGKPIAVRCCPHESSGHRPCFDGLEAMLRARP